QLIRSNFFRILFVMKPKNYILIIPLALILSACVPAKKYKELESKYQTSQENEALYKSQAIEYGNRLKEVEGELAQLKADNEELIAELDQLRTAHASLQVEYDRASNENSLLEKKYEQLMTSGHSERAKLIEELENTRV